MLSFLLSTGAFALMVGAMVILSRRSTKRVLEASQPAEKALLDAADVAERRHVARFGHIPADIIQLRSNGNGRTRA